MARVLLVWELGAQLAHLRNLERVARILASPENVVAVALRELDDATRCFGDLSVQFYQAPLRHHPSLAPPGEFLCFAHLLAAAGFDDEDSLTTRLSAWRSILDGFRPDLVVCDHSPTALLASRGLPVRRAVLGPGLFVPPPASPWGVLPGVKVDAARTEKIQHDEERVRSVVNAAADALAIPPLRALSDLHDGARSWLCTVPELDPFGPRPDESYYGVGGVPGAALPPWPSADGPRIFAYLAPFPRRGEFLASLRDAGVPVLVHGRGIPAPERARVSGETLRFVDPLVDLRGLAEACDLFVSNGSHGSVLQTLRAGVPQLVAPWFREQQYTASAVESLGAGVVVDARRGDFAKALEASWAAPVRDRARAFARRHEGASAREQRSFEVEVRSLATDDR
ncbi:MAG: glycosyltransferase family 1 protein [bacterium]|nr:glycosyltransferase family 1 protein [bacterium]